MIREEHREDLTEEELREGRSEEERSEAHSEEERREAQRSTAFISDERAAEIRIRAATERSCYR